MRNVLIAAAVVTLVSQIPAQTPAPAAPKVQIDVRARGHRDAVGGWRQRARGPRGMDAEGGTPFVGAEDCRPRRSPWNSTIARNRK